MLSSSEFTAGRVLRRRYRLDLPLIIGGSPELWRGEDLVLQRPVRIKLIHGGNDRDENFSQLVHTEAMATARLTHPNIIPTYDTGQVDNTTFVVLGEVDGRTITEIMASGPIDQSASASLIRQICDALDFAHNSGVIHGDVNPDNVVVIGSDHRVVLSDFGIAKAIRESDAASSADSPAANNPYLAPRQAAGEPINHLSDIWATGALLQALLDRRSEESEIDTGLMQIAEKAMSDQESEQFSSAREMSRALRRLELPSTSRISDDAWPNQSTSPAPQTQLVDDQSGIGNATVINGPLDNDSNVGGQNRKVLLPVPVPPNPPRSDQAATVSQGLGSSLDEPTMAVSFDDSQLPREELPTAETPIITTGQFQASTDQPTQSVHALDAVQPAPGVASGETIAEHGLVDSQDVARAEERRSIRRNLAIAIALIAILAAIVLGRLVGSSGDNRIAGNTQTTTAEATLVRASAFDPPPGDGDENSSQTNNVLDGNDRTFWSTQTYSSPTFGNLKKGVGLVLRSNGPTQFNKLELDTRNTGWSAQIFVANSPGTRLTDWKSPIDTQSGLPANATFDLHGAQGSAVLVWFTNMGNANKMSVIEAKLSN